MTGNRVMIMYHCTETLHHTLVIVTGILTLLAKALTWPSWLLQLE